MSVDCENTFKKKNILQKKGSSLGTVDLQEDLLTALLHSLLSEHCPPDVDDGGGVGDCADPDVEVAAFHQPVLHAGHHVAGVALTVSAAVYTDSIMYRVISK